MQALPTKQQIKNGRPVLFITNYRMILCLILFVLYFGRIIIKRINFKKIEFINWSVFNNNILKIDLKELISLGW